MALNLDIERLLAQITINLAFTRVSDIFRASTSFSCCETFSAPKGARKFLSPTAIILHSTCVILGVISVLSSVIVATFIEELGNFRTKVFAGLSAA